MREHILLGQNVASDRQKVRNRRLLVLMGACLVVGDVWGWCGGYQLGKAHSAPSWPPAGLTLVPAIAKPQGHLTAYVATDQNFLVQITFEPQGPGRLRATAHALSTPPACPLPLPALFCLWPQGTSPASRPTPKETDE